MIKNKDINTKNKELMRKLLKISFSTWANIACLKLALNKYNSYPFNSAMNKYCELHHQNKLIHNIYFAMCTIYL